MFFVLVCLVARRLLRALVGGPASAGLEVESAVLRDQLAVLKRTVKLPLLSPPRSVLHEPTHPVDILGT